MMVRVIGRPHGTIYQPNDVYKESEDGAVTCERTYRALYVDWLQRAPLRGTQHPIYPHLGLRQRSAAQIDPGFLCDVTLTYMSPRRPDQEEGEEPGEGEEGPGGGEGDGGDGEDGADGDTLPPPDYEESSSEIQIPIQQHPSWTSDFKQHWDFAKNNWKESAPAYLQGMTNYIVGSVMESETNYTRGKPRSVSEVVGQLTGNGHWLAVSGARRKQGWYWSRTINRLYSATPWPSQIYNP